MSRGQIPNSQSQKVWNYKDNICNYKCLISISQIYGLLIAIDKFQIFLHMLYLSGCKYIVFYTNIQFVD